MPAVEIIQRNPRAQIDAGLEGLAREGARYGGLDGSAGSFPARSLALALGYLFFPHYRYGLVLGVGEVGPPGKPDRIRYTK